MNNEIALEMLETEYNKGKEQKKKYIYSPEKVKEYNQRFFEKHSEPITCDICEQKYKYYSKNNHLKSKLHQVALKCTNKKL
jgi:hypothetical protein